MLQPMTSIDDILKENTFSEPRLVLFNNERKESGLSQCFVVAEKTLIFEVKEVNIGQALCSLIATYYVFHVKYPTSVPAYCLLMFIQEHLLELPDSSKKHARYSAFVNSIL